MAWAAAVPLVSARGAMPHADHFSPAGQAAWSFDGVTGPTHWSELSPDYAVCQFGIEQSPIDIVDAVKVTAPEALVINYRPVTAYAINESWTARLAFEAGCATTINGEVFALRSLLLRHPSEHLLSGRALEMELQLLHRSDTGARAMMAVFLRQGRKNDVLDHVMALLPPNPREKSVGFELNPLDLLPAPLEEIQMRPYYRYMGSLTKPPCTEGVIWSVFKVPIEASAKQIRDLSAMFPTNARPASRINRRYLLEYSA